MKIFPNILAAMAAFAGLLYGCSPASRAPLPPGPPPATQAKASRFAVPRTLVTSREAISINELFDRGMGQFRQGHWSQAAADLELAAEEGESQSWVPVAFYHAGLARDELGDFSASEENFDQAVKRGSAEPQSRDAGVRQVRLLSHLERWPEAGSKADILLRKYPDLGSFDALVARGGRALARVEQRELVQAESDIEAARTIIEDHKFDAPIRIHRDVAVIYFALGELRRQRADAIQFTLAPPNFAERLEQRCQLLLDAQQAYSTVMRAYDSHWSIMAGYRVGELYEKLHTDLMVLLAEFPLKNVEKQRLFEAALRLRYSTLLKKAVTLIEHTLAVADRTQQESKWVTLAREAQTRLNRAIALEQAALEQVPYSREQLDAGLQNLTSSRNSKK